MGTLGPILVVEDDEDIRETIAAVLADEGHWVVLAANGAEAIAYVRRQGALRPRLILLDLMMPVMSGWEFSAELRKDAASATIPVVVLSGDAKVEEKAAGLGAADLLRKPISLDKLFELVGRFG
jgi:CheY-like chemotaxis protein